MATSKRHEWWFTIVQPNVAGAAAIEAASDGDTLFLRAGGAQAELFPLGEPVWDTFRQIVAAVLAGDFSEVGNPADAIGRVAGPNGTRTFGPARIPIPDPMAPREDIPPLRHAQLARASG